jgi:hypothetical protein
MCLNIAQSTLIYARSNAYNVTDPNNIVSRVRDTSRFMRTINRLQLHHDRTILDAILSKISQRSRTGDYVSFHQLSLEHAGARCLMSGLERQG